MSALSSQEDFPTVVLALEVASQAVGPPPPSKPNPRYGHEDDDGDNYHYNDHQDGHAWRTLPWILTLRL